MSAARRFARYSSAVAEQVPSQKTGGKGRSDNMWVSLLGVGGTIGAVYTWIRLSADSNDEVEMKAKAAQRKANNIQRADPVAMSKEIADYLRFTDPGASPQLVHIGIQLCVAGYSDELAKHDKFYIMEKFKEKNRVMSWADLGAFVAYHALLEMGAPLVCMSPHFGRSEAQASSVAKQFRPLPPASATYKDLMQWGTQFDLTPAETVALLGGQSNGSVLFNQEGNDMEVNTVYYKELLKAKKEGILTDLPYPALLDDEFGRKCCVVYAGDGLYWNKYFVEGLNKVLLHKWDNLKELPNRMMGSTSDAAWATRQRKIYGISHEYSGAHTR